jgi:hypothetical protein
MAGVPDLSVEDQRAARILRLWCFVIEETASWSVPAVLRINEIAEVYEREARDPVWSECRTTGDRALSSMLSGLRPQDRENNAAAEHVMDSSPDSCSETKKTCCIRNVNEAV